MSAAHTLLASVTSVTSIGEPSAADRIGSGVTALIFAVAAMIFWLFLILFGSAIWRRMTRRQRVKWMRLTLMALLLGTAALLTFAPGGTWIEGDPGEWPNAYSAFVHRQGVTGWLERWETWTPGGTSTKQKRVDIAGLLMLLPPLILLGLGARYLGGWLPGMFRRPDHECDECGYDIRGSPSPVCPECGEVIS